LICVYPADCTDFSNNGLGAVSPSSCTVTETLNGEITIGSVLQEAYSGITSMNSCMSSTFRRCRPGTARFRGREM